MRPKLRWDQNANFEGAYDKHRDTLFLYKSPRRPAVSLDVDGLVWVRYEPTSGEVVGLEIEDFEKVFLVHHPELKLGWQKVRPTITKPFVNTNDGMQDYIRMFLELVKELLEAHPQQLQLT